MFQFHLQQGYADTKSGKKQWEQILQSQAGWLFLCNLSKGRTLTSWIHFCLQMCTCCFVNAMFNILCIKIKSVPRKLVQVQVIQLFWMSPDNFHIFLSRKFYTFMYRILRICSRKAKRKYYMKRKMNKMEVKAWNCIQPVWISLQERQKIFYLNYFLSPCNNSRYPM